MLTLSLLILPAVGAAQEAVDTRITLTTDTTYSPLIFGDEGEISLNSFELTVTGSSETSAASNRGVPIAGPGRLRIGDGQAVTTFTLNQGDDLISPSQVTIENDAMLDIKADQEVQRLVLNSGGAIDIAADTRLTIRTNKDAEASILNGAVTGGSGSTGGLQVLGDGELVISSPLNLDSTGKVIVNDSSTLSLATSDALGDVGLQLNFTLEGVSLAIDAENAFSTTNVLRLPSYGTLKVNANQTLTDLEITPPGKTKPGAPPPENPLIQLSGGSTLTFISTGTVSDPKILNGEIIGAGNLTFSSGAYVVQPDGRNTFSGVTTVENGATLKVGDFDSNIVGGSALSASPQLNINQGAVVELLPSNENPLNSGMNVRVDGQLSVESGSSANIDSLIVSENGVLTINSGAALSIGGSNGNSVIDGTVNLVNLLRIGGTGTTAINKPINIGTFGAGIDILPGARIVVADANVFAVDPFDISVVRDNFSIAEGAVLDLNVTGAFESISKDGWYADSETAGTNLIPNGARFNLNAPGAIVSNAEFTFGNAQSTLAVNNIKQTLSGPLIGNGQVLGTGNAVIDLGANNPDFKGVVSIQDRTVLNLNTPNALGDGQIVMNDTAGINFNAGGEFRWRGAFRSFGVLSGNPRLILTDNAAHEIGGRKEAFTGRIEVQAGTLTLNGTLGDSASQQAELLIGDGAVLRGDGTFLGAVTISDGARHEPGNSVGTPTFFEYTLASGATLAIEFEQGPDGALISDQIIVSNRATIGGGSGAAPVIEVSGLPSDRFYNGQDVFTVIKAEPQATLSINQDPRIISTFNAPLLDLRSRRSGNDYQLIIQRTAYQDVVPNLMGPERVSASVLDKLVPTMPSGSQGELVSVVQDIDKLGQAVLNRQAGSQRAYQQTMRALSGQRILTQDAAHLASLQAWSDRLNGHWDHPVKVAVYSNDMRGDEQGARDGFKSRLNGVVLAAEHAVNDEQAWRFGLGFEDADTQFMSSGGQGQLEAARLSVSYALDPNNRWRARAQVIAGYSMIDYDRPIGGLGLSHTGKTDAIEAGVYGEAAFDLLSGKQWKLSALGGVKSHLLQRAGFDESGSSLALQTINKRSLELTQGVLGLQFNKALSKKHQGLSFNGKARWLHTLQSSVNSSSAQFIADGFESEALNLVDAKPDDDALTVDLSLIKHLTQRLTADLGYQGYWGDTLRYDAASITLNYRF